MSILKNLKQSFLTIKVKIFSFFKNREKKKQTIEVSPSAELIQKEKDAVLDLFDIYMLTDKLTNKERRFIREWKDHFPKNNEFRKRDLSFSEELEKIKYEAESVRGIMGRKPFVSERNIAKFNVEELDFYIQRLQEVKAEKERLIKSKKWTFTSQFEKLEKIFSK
jgi:hypothetical protein